MLIILQNIRDRANEKELEKENRKTATTKNLKNKNKTTIVCEIIQRINQN